jgi:hypothetical protein
MEEAKCCGQEGVEKRIRISIGRRPWNIASLSKGVQLRLFLEEAKKSFIITKQESRKHQHLHPLATRIAYICEISKIRLFAVYLPGSQNIIANQFSRKNLHPQDEQKMHHSDFHQIEESFGRRAIDLFASNDNHQLQQYFSRNADRMH